MYLAMYVCVNIHSSDQIGLKGAYVQILILSLHAVSLNILMFMTQIGHTMSIT